MMCVVTDHDVRLLSSDLRTEDLAAQFVLCVTTHNSCTVVNETIARLLEDWCYLCI